MNRNRIWQQEPAQEGKRESFGIAEHKMFIFGVVERGEIVLTNFFL